MIVVKMFGRYFGAARHLYTIGSLQLWGREFMTSSNRNDCYQKEVYNALLIRVYDSLMTQTSKFISSLRIDALIIRVYDKVANVDAIAIGRLRIDTLLNKGPEVKRRSFTIAKRCARSRSS